MFYVAALEVVDLVEVIICIFNVVGSVITIICIYYLGEATLVLADVEVGILDHLWAWRVLLGANVHA